MATPPPNLPTPNLPRFGSNVEILSIDAIVSLVVNAIVKHPAVELLMQKVTGASAPEWLARRAAFQPEVWIRKIRTAREVISRLESEVQPNLVEFLLDGLNDFFGTKLGPDSVRLHGILGEPKGTATQLGRAVLTALFQGLESPREITPEIGWENLQRIISFAMGTSLEGWLTGNIEKTLFFDILPEWGSLDDLVTENLGIGRLTRRVLAPLMNALIIEPSTRRINATFRPAFYNEAQATRALNAGAIGEEAYFGIMGELGWSRERAGVLRLLGSKLLSEGEIEKGRDVGAIGEAEAIKALRALGFSGDVAQQKFRIDELARQRKVEDAVASVARDMFRDRELGEGEYRSALKAAGKSEGEIEGFLGLGRIERARPKRLSQGTIERAFEDGLVSLSRLRRWYEQEGFSLEDQVLLEQLALRRRLEEEKRAPRPAPPPEVEEGPPLPRGTAEELHRQGLITDSELAAAYRALGFTGARVDLLLRLAASRRQEREEAERKKAVPPPSPVAPRDAIEQAFIRGIVDEGRLRAFYEQVGIPERDIPALLEVMRQRRQEFTERQAERVARRREAGAPPAPELPKAAAEEAHRVGLLSTEDLRAFYRRLRFADPAIGQLVALAEQRRREYVEAQRRRQAPPPPAELPRSAAEAAFERGLLDEDQLETFYRGQGFIEDDVQLLLELARIRATDHAAADRARELQAASAKHKARP